MSSTVMMVGAGGLGAPVAYYLTAVGVGKLIIVDSDIVELSNLNRQILHFTADIGRLKTDSAKEKLTALNPDCRVETYSLRITPQNASEMFQKADLIVDCTDGFTSKYLLNDTAVLTRKTLIHAGVLAFGGQLMVIRPDSACLRCVFPEPPPLDVAPPSLTGGHFRGGSRSGWNDGGARGYKNHHGNRQASREPYAYF